MIISLTHTLVPEACPIKLHYCTIISTHKQGAGEISSLPNRVSPNRPPTYLAPANLAPS